MFLALLIIISLIDTKICYAKITDKQYASMPVLFHEDNFDQCMLFEDEALFCSFTYELQPLDVSNTSEIWNIINEVSSDKFNYRHDHLRHGICVPMTCPNASKEKETLREGINKCYDEKFHRLGLKGNITTINCETNEPKYPIDWVDLIVALMFICYMAIVIFSSFYEKAARFKNKVEYQKITNTRWGKIICAFSVPRNWRRLSTIKTTPETEKLRCFQGVRFYNTILVILSHICLCSFVGPVSNTKYTESMNDKYANLFLSSGSLCVSTNFYMTSFFLCYGLLSQFENKEDIKLKHIFIALIHRYIRLTPTLFVVATFHATWLRHLGSGPNWNYIIERDFLNCRKNWWTNMLYMNNFINKENMCLPHTWYLALDTQYFVILLLIVMFMKKYPKLIWPALGFLLISNMIGTFIQNYTYNFTAFFIPTPESVYNLNNILPHPQWHFQTASEIGCFAGGIVGLGYGYTFYKNRNKKTFHKHRIFQEIMHFVVGYGGALGIIIIPGYLVMYLRIPHNAFWASFYNAVNRPIFTLSVGYVLHTVMHNVGLGTKNVLEWSPLYVLGRLTYSAYLIHLSFVQYRPATARFPLYVDAISIVTALFEAVFITYIGALLVTLCLELPFSELQKILLSSKLESSKVKEAKTM